MNGWHLYIGKRFAGFARGVMGMKALLNWKQAGELLLLMVLTTVIAACVPNKSGGGIPVQRSDISLDLPLEPAATRTRMAALPVQTTPPPLKTGSAVPHPPVDLPPPSRPAREFGIPARDSGVINRGVPARDLDVTTQEFGVPARDSGVITQEPISPNYQAQQTVKKKKKKKKKKSSTTKPTNSSASRAATSPNTQARSRAPLEVRPRPPAGLTEVLPPK